MTLQGMEFTRLRRSALEYLREAIPHSRNAAERSLLERKANVLSSPRLHSFVLPDNGEIIRRDTPSALTLEGCHLPFETLALEYSIPDDWWGNKEAGKNYPTATVLVVDQPNCRGSIRVFCLWRAGRAWVPFPHAIEMTEKSTVTVAADGYVWVEHAEILSFEGYEGAESSESVIKNMADEMRVVAHFILLANCSNVRAEKVFAPSPALVKRSTQRGKLPPDEYYVLDCFLGEHQIKTEPAGGQHLSPRFHVRRGHVRRLPSGSLTWVRQCTVGDASLGRIDKDYRVRVRA